MYLIQTSCAKRTGSRKKRKHFIRRNMFLDDVLIANAEMCLNCPQHQSSPKNNTHTFDTTFNLESNNFNWHYITFSNNNLQTHIIDPLFNKITMPIVCSQEAC